MTTKEKANRYDALVFAIGMEKKRYDGRLSSIDEEIEKSNESVGAMLIGKKYAYKEFSEIMGRWC